MAGPPRPARLGSRQAGDKRWVLKGRLLPAAGTRRTLLLPLVTSRPTAPL